MGGAELATADVDPQLGEHTNGPVMVTSDGGVIDGGVIDAGDEGEIVDAGVSKARSPKSTSTGTTQDTTTTAVGCGGEAMREKDLSDCCDRTQLTQRMPDDLLDDVDELAETMGMSRNAAINMLVKRGLDGF